MAEKTMRVRVAEYLAGVIGGRDFRTLLGSITSQVNDSGGWSSLLSPGGHDRDSADVQELYEDALKAWRKNPFAKRYIEATTDFVVGDSVRLSSKVESLNDFIIRFWNHPKNRMMLRLESMCEELTRAGDLFVALFRNDQDGMSYIRFVTKDEVSRIKTLPNDWETEIAYFQKQNLADEKKWVSPELATSKTKAIMLHYAINRPIGALLGESDLASIIPWLLRYSRMLEDRVKLHWAAKIFLWLVTVPTNKVQSTTNKYRQPPESGTVIVKDDGEVWEVQTPSLHGADSAHDLKAVRGMIDAGSGFPAYYRGEAGDANLATATAMQAPTERRLQRRQKYFIYMLEDIIYQAYQRAVIIDKAEPLPTTDYRQLFEVDVPEISRQDNRELATAAHQISRAMRELSQHLPNRSKNLSRLVLRLVMKFAGEPLSAEEIEEILSESYISDSNKPE
jgi:hypothetical protein